MNTSTAWFFGDSFTYGHGLHDDDEYVKLYPQLKNKLWSEMLCDEFNWNYNNLGRPGASSQYILMKLIENLHKFKKNDKVFISDTLPVRTDCISLYGENQHPIIVPFTNEEFTNYSRHDDTSNQVDNVYRCVPKSKIPQLVDYIYSFIFDYEDTWELYWIESFKNIQKHLSNLNIDCYIWSHRIWASKQAEYMYSTISDETNGIVDDGHWGWHGQTQMYEYMKSRVNNNLYFNSNEFYKVKGIWSEPPTTL